jgi:hypothetical protein
MPKSEYYQYVPLTYPRPVRQAAGSRDMALYGDVASPSYRDVDPVDGIDDERHRVLHEMGIKFAPYLVMNSTAVPMDWRKFMNGRSAWNLYVDTWNQTNGGEWMTEDQIDWLSLPGNPCPVLEGEATLDQPDDCRLLSLLEQFDPDDPQSEWYRHAAVSSFVDPFKIMYWNFPGHDEESWKREFEDPVSGELRSRYWDLPKTYLHPFVEEVRDEADRLIGYELVLQYWFFYSYNDGGNNHEGDWEHVNVIVSQKAGVTRPQTPQEIQFMLDGGGIGPEAGDDYVVIKRVDYYLHEKVWTLDYAHPNVYAPRAEWDTQVATLPQAVTDERRVWQQIRERAYEDAAETVINTHVVGFIGADNKGLDQVLAAPGGKNRDSHGTYPFRGLYMNVGPTGVSEQISAKFDYQEYFAGPRPGLEDGRLGRGSVVRLDRADRIEIMPDWERVHEMLYTDPAVREQWAWLILPIRWGYPATSSPFMGVAKHVNSGNLAPQTGAQNKGWNRSGAGSGFHDYEPHRYSGYWALGWQDSFQNDLGWLNLTYPTLAILPPFDVVVKLISAPINLATDAAPTYIATDEIPFRFVALEGGAIRQRLDSDFTALFLNEDNLLQVLDALGFTPADLPDVVVLDRILPTTLSPYLRTMFFVGRRFASENAFWAPRFEMTGVLEDASGDPRELTADVKMWEWAGSARFNLATGTFQPYGKLGYGVTWFRLENQALDGQLLDHPTSKTVHPFTWHYGFGAEWLLMSGADPPPGGVDVGLRFEFAHYSHSLELDQFTSRLSAALGNRNTGLRVGRNALSLAVTVGF